MAFVQCTVCTNVFHLKMKFDEEKGQEYPVPENSICPTCFVKDPTLLEALERKMKDEKKEL